MTCTNTYHCPDCKYNHDLVRLDLSISRSEVRSSHGDIRELRYAFPNKESVNYNKTSLYRWFLKKVIAGSDFSCCVDECDLEALYERMNRDYPSIGHTICRTDLQVDEKNRESWNLSNPYCVSRHRWEKLLYQQCDLTFTTSHEIIPCELVAYFSAAKVACDLEFQQTITPYDCRIHYDALVEQYDCSLSYDEYAKLLDCNLTINAINYVYSCDMELQAGAGLYDCTLITQDGAAVRIGDLLETDTENQELRSFLEGGCDIDLNSISTELLS